MHNVKDIFRPLIPKDNSIKDVRKNILNKYKGKYFDYTASGLAHKYIEQRMKEVLFTYANTHSQYASNSKTTSYYYDLARKKLKTNMNLDDKFVIIPCGNGATGAIKKFQEILGIYIPPSTREYLNLKNEQINNKPLVIIGPFEHHSNEVSFRESLCDTIRIPLNKKGNIDCIYLENILIKNKSRKIIGSFSVASNVTGIVSPYKEISKLLRKYNCIIAFDTAASASCMDIPNEMYDAIYVSPHKFLGGPGTCGLLIIRRNLINTNISPTFAGGGTVEYVSSTEHIFNSDIETREDAGTPAIYQFIKTSLVYQLRNEVGLEKIKNIKQELYIQFKEKLECIKGCTIYGPDNMTNMGIISLNFVGIAAFELCEILSKNYGIQTRAGCSCAGPYGHDLFGISTLDNKDNKPSWLRISIHYTHIKEDFDYLFKAIVKSINNKNLLRL